VADLAAVGSADAVRRHLKRYLDAGATDVVLNSLDTESGDAAGLWEVAASI
jgi:alkanesulfonate monooxygenase SsuD/methylene tetrahydromethanopterin reductase-like flavin-dependent oxidoreductase (luciferase family)